MSDEYGLCVVGTDVAAGKKCTATAKLLDRQGKAPVDIRKLAGLMTP